MGAGAAAAAFLAAAMPPGPAEANGPPEGLVWLALRDLNAAYFDPDDPTNRPPLATEPPPGMIRAVEITDDGRADWLIDYGAAGLPSYCGTGGCLQRLYVSHGDGYVRVFDNQALDLSVLVAGGERRLEAWVHHTWCGDDRDCRYAWGWNAVEGRLEPRPASNGRRPGADRPFEPVRSAMTDRGEAD